ncbi:MAG TPA: hypothetical protein VIS74_05465 [Chthoniobacterales bacterium]
MRSLLLLAVVLLLPGCLFEKPITGPSRSINTWMLGVWEFPKKNGERLQAMVVPKDNDHYAIYLREFTKGRKLKSIKEYDAWISRVGLVSFLTVKVDGQYCPVHFQLLSPVEIRLRLPDFDPGSEALTPYELRQQVRRKFKEGTLLTKEGEIWTKVSEIYWPAEGNPGDQPANQPLRHVPQPAQMVGQ